MEKKINEKILRFVGSSCLTEGTKIELGDDVEISVTGSVINVVDKDNQDGTKNREYVVKIITSIVK